VNDVPFSVDHDVSVVTILDLKDVAGDRVGGHTLDEVHSSLLEGNRVHRSVLVDEEAEKIVDLGSAHLVSGGSVGNDIDDSTLIREKRERRELRQRARKGGKRKRERENERTPGAVAVTL